MAEKKTLTFPKNWFAKLLLKLKNIDDDCGDRDESQAYLKGYIESAEEFIK